MIRVNLLEGAADTRAATRATKAVAKTTQQLLLVVGAVVVLLILLAVDYMVSTARLADANEQLQEQQQIAAVKNRIKIIEDLEKTQKGPSAMLDLINRVMPPRSDIVLDAITQQSDNLSITGTARSEEIVSSFARGLELGSGGLFQALAVQTAQRVENVPVDPNDPENKETRQEVVYTFTLSTKFTPTAVGQPQQADAAAAGK
jgi:Tfp pilus assembly protein PilN